MPLGAARGPLEHGAGSIFLVTVSVDANNQNLRTIANTAGYTGSGGCKITINGGVTIGSTTAAATALVRGTWPVGVIPLLIVKGHIRGCGGAGGAGGNVAVLNGGYGGTGGLALDSTAGPLSVDNSLGSIDGGGGGGGGGAALGTCGIAIAMGGGGGGGEGVLGGVGGAGGYGGSVSGSSGTDGTSSAAGLGGAGGNAGCCSIGGAGGNAGVFGGYGGVGADASGNTGGAGGAPGGAVDGNANIIWIATGTRNGPIT